MTTAATPSDILRAVERWARVRGWLDDGEHSAEVPWSIYLQSSGGVLLWEKLPPAQSAAWGAHYISPAIALAWALLVESEAAPVDVGRCPACAGDGVNRREQPAAGRAVRFECPACNGTGRETIPAERLLLDAVSGDANARALLEHHADATLRDRGDQLGDLLAWALTLWTGEPTEIAAMCERCHGMGSGTPVAHGPFEQDGRVEFVMTTPACSTCGGYGAHFGHPHTAEAIRWLEWLTWAREFAAERRGRWPASDEEWAEWGEATRQFYRT